MASSSSPLLDPLDKVFIRKFNFIHDLDIINDWYRERKMRAFPEQFLPKHGMIVPGVAAGFLYITDCDLAFLDGFIANPNALKLSRNAALDAITASLLCVAKENGCSMVKCDTKVKAIEERAQRFGFKALGYYKSFAREI